MMFEVVSTLVVIDTSKGKINTIAIDNPNFVVLSNFLNAFIILGFKVFVIVDSANIQQHLNAILIYN